MIAAAAAGRGGGNGELQAAQDIVTATLGAAAGEGSVAWIKVVMAQRGWRGTGVSRTL
jgi:hypothetical protein